MGAQAEDERLGNGRESWELTDLKKGKTVIARNTMAKRVKKAQPKIRLR